MNSYIFNVKHGGMVNRKSLQAGAEFKLSSADLCLILTLHGNIWFKGLDGL